VANKAQAIVKIRNRLGLHARPAMEFVDAASAHSCSVRVRRIDGETDEIMDGKSIMQMMMLAATEGTELEITCDGDDAKDACATLEKLVNSKFGEE
jgi:phosphocarrier protein